MSQTLALRTTSLAASSALVALGVLAALSVTYTITRNTPTVLMPPIIAVTEPPPAPPPRRPQTPPRTPQRNAIETPAIAETQPAAIADLAPSVPSGVTTPGPVTIENPRWTQRPRDLARYYPRRALDRRVEGVVDLDCIVGLQGRLACTVLSETPVNWGFGEAALRIARDHVMVPATRNGEAVEGRYRMRTPFRLD